jgi:hypothetical protein
LPGEPLRVADVIRVAMRGDDARTLAPASVVSKCCCQSARVGASP